MAEQNDIVGSNSITDYYIKTKRGITTIVCYYAAGQRSVYFIWREYVHDNFMDYWTPQGQYMVV